MTQRQANFMIRVLRVALVAVLCLISTPSPAPTLNFATPAAFYNPSRKEFVSVVGRLKDDGTHAVSAYIYNSRGELSDGPRDLAVSLTALPFVSVATDSISQRALVVWQTTTKVSGVVLSLADYSKIKSLTIRTVAVANPTEVGVAHSPNDGFRVVWANVTLLDTRLVAEDGTLGTTTTMHGAGGLKEHVSLVYVPGNDSFTAIFLDGNIHAKNSTRLAAELANDLGVAPDGSMATIAATTGDISGVDYASVVLLANSLTLEAHYLSDIGALVGSPYDVGDAANQVPAFAKEGKGNAPVFFNSYDTPSRVHYFASLPTPGPEASINVEPPGSPLTNAYYGYAAAYSGNCDRYFGTATDGEFLDATSTGPVNCPASIEFQPGMLDFGVGAPSQQSFDLNITGAPVIVTSIEIIGEGKHAYKIDNPTACKRHIQQNSQCRIMVSHVAASNNQQAALKVVSDSFINPAVMIPLTDGGSGQSGGFISLVAPPSAKTGIDPANATLIWQGVNASTTVQYRVSACTDPGLTSCVQSSSVITGR